MTEPSRWLSSSAAPPGCRELLLAGRDVPDFTPSARVRVSVRLATAAAVTVAMQPRATAWAAVRTKLVGMAVAAAVVGAAAGPSVMAILSRPLPDAPRAARDRAASTTAALPKLIAAAAPAPAVGEDEIAREVLLDVDFEDGSASGALRSGAIVEGPARTDGHLVALGSLNPHALDYLPWSVSLFRLPGLFVYSHATRLSFDYWAAPGATELVLQFTNADRDQNYSRRRVSFQRGHWAHADVSLRDFVGNIRRGQALEEGDRITRLDFLLGTLGGAPFYVDNVRVWTDPAVSR